MNNYLKTYSESHNFTQSYETLKLRNYAHQNEIQFKIFRVAINDTSSLFSVHKLLIAPTTISSASCGIIMVHIVYIYAIYLLLPWLQLWRSLRNRKRKWTRGDLSLRLYILCNFVDIVNPVGEFDYSYDI